jgi:hypothetical protein
VCRALKVLVVAPDPATLSRLKRDAVSADWELTAGASTEAEAMAQLESERPHVLVAFGGFEGFVRAARERQPFLRIVTDRPVAVETVVVVNGSDLRAAIKGLPRAGGPVT